MWNAIKEWKHGETTLEEIESLAYKLSNANQSWHFHILTKNCLLNKSDSYIFMLEIPGTEEIFEHRCDHKPAELGKRLVQLLHGNDVLQEHMTETPFDIPSVDETLIKTAKELSAKKISWHHHMLFPDCVFNKHKSKWTVILENTANPIVLESISDKEPKLVLRAIEKLFYEQLT